MWEGFFADMKERGNPFQHRVVHTGEGVVGTTAAQLDQVQSGVVENHCVGLGRDGFVVIRSVDPLGEEGTAARSPPAEPPEATMRLGSIPSWRHGCGPSAWR